ncbi:helix-turn-helix domain-containing protein [Scytonema sp. NUACC26]|uniref:helix-turn-helix domain-containing protein n=1 Tax=Scytonema sp. NUACC26 TaxID=3140176 RepID=UPI0034DC500B
MKKVSEISQNIESTTVSQCSQIKPYLTTLSSSKAAWNGIVVEHNVDSAIDAHETIAPGHLVTVHYGNSATLEWTAEGRTKRAIFAPGDITINPFRNSVKPQWEERAEFILVAIEPQLITRIADESMPTGRIEMVMRFDVRDPLIEHIALALMSEVEQGGLTNRLYAESLANALAFHLVKNYSASPSHTQVYSGGLSPRQLQRAIDYINDHLDQTISLTDLANAVEVSSSHFARAFKQSTGIPPHKYLTQQRIMRAKNLLSNTNLPLTEISLELGFSSQGHFTTVFRQLTGVTPKSYRQAS